MKTKAQKLVEFKDVYWKDFVNIKKWHNFNNEPYEQVYNFDEFITKVDESLPSYADFEEFTEQFQTAYKNAIKYDYKYIRFIK